MGGKGLMLPTTAATITTARTNNNNPTITTSTTNIINDNNTNNNNHHPALVSDETSLTARARLRRGSAPWTSPLPLRASARLLRAMATPWAQDISWRCPSPNLSFAICHLFSASVTFWN